MAFLFEDGFLYARPTAFYYRMSLFVGDKCVETIQDKFDNVDSTDSELNVVLMITTYIISFILMIKRDSGPVILAP
jgi:hypothetical protein